MVFLCYMIKEWELIESKIDRDYRVFRIKAEMALSPRTKKIGQFYTIDTNDWVNIIPVTANNEVVMIKQYRHGSKEITFEIPGGLVDEEITGRQRSVNCSKRPAVSGKISSSLDR